MKKNNEVLSFGEHIRLMREGKCLTLRDLSLKIGIDASLLGKIERDKRRPTNDQIKLLAVFFNLDEKLLIRVNLSDQLAYKIIDANISCDVFKIAEQKIEYLKKKK